MYIIQHTLYVPIEELILITINTITITSLLVTRVSATLIMIKILKFIKFKSTPQKKSKKNTIVTFPLIIEL